MAVKIDETERTFLGMLISNDGRMALDASNDTGRAFLLVARLLAEIGLVTLQADATNLSISHCEITAAGRDAYGEGKL